MGAFETQQMAPLDVLPPPLVKDNNASLPLVCFAGGKWGGDERVTAQVRGAASGAVSRTAWRPTI